MKLFDRPARTFLVLALLSAAASSGAEMRAAALQQERPGVAPPAAEPNFTLTRHGSIVFEANVAAPDAHGASRILLTETVEISGIKNAQDWLEFVHAFAGSTGRALLDALPASVSTKKGKIVATFALRRDGGIDGAISVAHSSGNSSVDDATRLAIAKSAPFRELPANFPSAAAQFRVTFAYKHPHPLPPDGDSQ